VPRHTARKLRIHNSFPFAYFVEDTFVRRLRMIVSSFFNFSLLACIFSLLSGAFANNVIDLTPSNFDEIVGGGKPALVRIPRSTHSDCCRSNSLLPGVATGRFFNL